MSLSEKSIGIERETFSPVRVSDSNSSSVCRNKKQLLGEVDLEEFVSTLSQVGKLLRVAYNGVAEHTDLQIKVRHIGYTITTLVDNSSLIVNNCKAISSEVLMLIESAYGFLLDGFEDLAIATLKNSSGFALKMYKACEELHDEFEAAKADMIKTLEDAKKLEGSEREEKEKTFERQYLEAKLKVAQQKQEDGSKAENMKEIFHSCADHNSITRSVLDALVKIVKAGASVTSLDPEKVPKEFSEMEDISGFKEVMAATGEEKMKPPELMQKQREVSQQGIERDKELMTVAIEVLHESIGLMEKLSIIMMRASLFWQQMSTHCEYLSGEEVKSMIKRVINLDEETRLKVWKSRQFKTEAAHYCDRWKALYVVCDNCMLKIKKTRKDLYKFLEENPTIEQSYHIVRQWLATKPMKVLYEAKKKKKPFESFGH